MTVFFRRLATLPADLETARNRAAEALIEPIADAFYDPSSLTPEDTETWGHWLRRYIARVADDARTDAERSAAMNAVNPKYVLRNYLAQEAIELAESGDPSRITELLDVMRHPYDEQPERERFAAKRPEWARDKAGCSALSCSS